MILMYVSQGVGVADVTGGIDDIADCFINCKEAAKGMADRYVSLYDEIVMI